MMPLKMPSIFRVPITKFFNTIDTLLRRNKEEFSGHLFCISRTVFCGIIRGLWNDLNDVGGSREQPVSTGEIFLMVRLCSQEA